MLTIVAVYGVASVFAVVAFCAALNLGLLNWQVLDDLDIEKDLNGDPLGEAPKERRRIHGICERMTASERQRNTELLKLLRGTDLR